MRLNQLLLALGDRMMLMSPRRPGALGVVSMLMVLTAWLALHAPESPIPARIYDRRPSPKPTARPEAGVTPLLPDVYRIGGDVHAPRLVRKVEPAIPPSVRAKRVEAGMVIVEAIIMEDGTVGYPRILTSYEPDVDAEVLRAVKEWRYQPATQNGRPVRVYLTISSLVHAR